MTWAAPTGLPVGDLPHPRRRVRIGYAKFGRSMTFNANRFGFQGDAEAPNLLVRLARRNPDVTWVVVGRHTPVNGIEMPPNVEFVWDKEAQSKAGWWMYTDGRYVCGICKEKSPYECGCPGGTLFSEQEAKMREIIRGLDGCVVHLGQHGGASTRIPLAASVGWAGEERTQPQVWTMNYGGYLIHGLNALGDRTNGEAPVIWLCVDPRNYLKARDVKWLTGTDGILSQYRYERDQRHDRLQDKRPPAMFNGVKPKRLERNDEIWIAHHKYEYGGLELLILPDDWEHWGKSGFDERQPVGVASTSFNVGTVRRSQMIRDVVLSRWPTAEVYGKWDETSLKDVPEGTVIENNPAEFPELLARWRVTIALPALGSGWTVAKPYQCFAARTVCMMYGDLDDQGFVLPTPLPPDAPRHQKKGGAGLKKVADGLWSVREDWTESDLQLAAWLRFVKPNQFHARAEMIAESQELWASLVAAQRDLLTRRWNEARCETLIERRLGL